MHHWSLTFKKFFIKRYWMNEGRCRLEWSQLLIGSFFYLAARGGFSPQGSKMSSSTWMCQWLRKMLRFYEAIVQITPSSSSTTCMNVCSVQDQIIFFLVQFTTLDQFFKLFISWITEPISWFHFLMNKERVCFPAENSSNTNLVGYSMMYVP